jgi:hypothetical protein
MGTGADETAVIGLKGGVHFFRWSAKGTDVVNGICPKARLLQIDTARSARFFRLSFLVGVGAMPNIL